MFFFCGYRYMVSIGCYDNNVYEIVKIIYKIINIFKSEEWYVKVSSCCCFG